MSTITYSWSKPGKESAAGPEFGDCCGQRPILLRWKRHPDIVGVICQRVGCINNSEGVLACDVDIVKKWEGGRNPQPIQPQPPLLPCPFCHSTDLSTTVTSEWRAFVACGVCLAAGPVVSSDVSEGEARGLAEVLWNGRGGASGIVETES